MVDLVHHRFYYLEAVAQHHFMAAAAVVFQFGSGDIVAISNAQHAVALGHSHLVANHGGNGIFGAIAHPYPQHFIVQEDGPHV